MYLIQNFSNQKNSKITPFDRLVWLVGLIHYKSFGYKTKIYCTEEDVEFLKENYFLEYYDEVDTETLSNCKWLDNINEDYFWFFRKIVCMENEFKLQHKFIYSDTDIILKEPVDLENCDLLVWGLENVGNEEEQTLYCPWNEISMPPNYTMPEYIKNTTSINYNCGLLYFKNPDVFYKWKEDMLQFAKNNPCEIYADYLYQFDAVFACNCEQRILKGLSQHLNLQVQAIDTEAYSMGITPKGAHFYAWRSIWRTMSRREEWAKQNMELWQQAVGFNWAVIAKLADFTEDLLNELKEKQFLFEWVRFMNNPDIHDLLSIEGIYRKILNWGNKKEEAQ